VPQIGYASLHASAKASWAAFASPEIIACALASAVAGGDALLSPSVTKQLIEEFATRAKEPVSVDGLEELTDREREVVALVAEGLSNDEIAERLVLSPATAKTHVSRAMGKLRARDRAQLVVIAYESGLVRPGWLG
jgi:DNA-binding NarL/FixJ family response regulator